MTASKIEWTDKTWNPTRGCSRVSEGCRNCYAERQAARFSKPGEPFHAFAESVLWDDPDDRRASKSAARWTGKVALIPEKLADPLRWKRPRRVFVDSMSDLFHESLSNEAIAAVFGVMASAPRHTFQVLTKRPERMRAWFAWLEAATARCAVVFPHDGEAWRRAHVLRAAAYRTGYDGVQALLNVSEIEALGWPLPNVWLGVSVEDQATANPRIPELLGTPAAVRFVSAEPLLGPVDFERAQCSCPWPADAAATRHNLRCLADTRRPDDQRRWSQLHWVIVGGESGPGARLCDVNWIRAIVRQCARAGTACFVKQVGARCVTQHPMEPGALLLVKTADRKGGDPFEWTADLRVREFPRAVGAVS